MVLIKKSTKAWNKDIIGSVWGSYCIRANSAREKNNMAKINVYGKKGIRTFSC